MTAVSWSSAGGPCVDTSRDAGHILGNVSNGEAGFHGTLHAAGTEAKLSDSSDEIQGKWNIFSL